MKKGISTLLAVCLTAVIVLAIVAGGWYYSDRKYQNEQKALRDQIADLQSEIKQIQEVASSTSVASTTASSTSSTAFTDVSSDTNNSGASSSTSTNTTTAKQTLTVDSNGIKVGSVTIDNAALATLQTAVDTGHQPWRLEPLDTAQADALAYGFTSDDVNSFTIISQAGSAGVAEIAASHNGKKYIINLKKPIPGDGRIWAISSIQVS